MKEDKWSRKCVWENYCTNDPAAMTPLECMCRDDMEMNTETGNENWGKCTCTEGKTWVMEKSRCEFSLEDECPGQWRERNNECMVFTDDCED